MDFCALMHTVSVSGVARHEDDRIKSRTDLNHDKLTFAVFVEEVGDEILKDQLRIPDARLRRQESWSIAEIIDMVATKKVDVAIADTLSCCAALELYGSRKPKLKPILKDHPISRCPNGVMIGLNQTALSMWLHEGLVKILKHPEFRNAEHEILSKYAGVIEKIM